MHYKPKLAIVSSHNICCPLAYYADALKAFLSPSFNVEILDLRTTLLRSGDPASEKLGDAYIDELCARLADFDVVNIHLELGLFGTSLDRIMARLTKLCGFSGRLILTVHTIDYKNNDHGLAYQGLIAKLKNRPPSNPFHLIAHLPHEKELLQQHFSLNNVSDFPLIYLTNERRRHFQTMKNPTLWKKQFGFNEHDKTIGVFGLLSAHKNYLHTLRTLKLLPEYYKLLIIGEAHHMNIKEWQVDPVIQEMINYLDQNPNLANRVFFTGQRPDEKYYEDLVNVDFVLLSSFEVRQSGSATLSNALELSCAILKSNIYNAREYDRYFPNCFEVFDVGNHYETKDKILHFDQGKIDRLRQRTDHFSEVQLCRMYLDIYDSMRDYSPVHYAAPEEVQPVMKVVPRVQWAKAVFRVMPPSIQTVLRKIKKKALGYISILVQ